MTGKERMRLKRYHEILGSLVFFRRTLVSLIVLRSMLQVCFLGSFCFNHLLILFPRGKKKGGRENRLGFEKGQD